jgi:hypothetical protein
MGNAVLIPFSGSSFKIKEKDEGCIVSIPLHALPPIWVELRIKRGLALYGGEMFN